MTGPFIAHETVLKCSTCSRAYGSETLLQMVPGRCNVAFDIMVHAGQALFRRHRTLNEVQAELMLRNVRLCTSQIDHLGRKFIACLALGHRQATPRIRQKMQFQGGYVLHIDATHEADAPALMTGMDSLSQFVLANVKIPSENAAQISSFLRDIQRAYGKPAACVHDMGTGICKAVAETFPGVADFICHFHFLRDIGKDFLEPSYNRLRIALRKHALSTELSLLVRQMRQLLLDQNLELAPLAKAFTTSQPLESSAHLALISAYSMGLWVLYGKQSGNGYGFPFDRPLLYFARRLLYLDQRLPEILQLLPGIENRESSSLFKLVQKISKSAGDPEIQQAVKELGWRVNIFDSLRKSMRIAPVDGKAGLNDDGTPEKMSSIRRRVESFRSKLKHDRALANDALCLKMGQQIDKYAEKLFADPVTVVTSEGKVKIYPQRTNNILEQFFRGLRRGQRRKTGNNSLRRTLQTMIADTPLVKNLDNPEYMKMLLNGHSGLEELFASMETQSILENVNPKGDSDRILPGFRSIVKDPSLPELVVQLLANTAQSAKSN